MASVQQINCEDWKGAPPNPSDFTSVCSGDAMVWVANENATQTPVRSLGVFSNLHVNIGSLYTAGTETFTFRVNGVNGNQTISIAQNVTGDFFDNVNTDTPSAGALVNVQITGTWSGSPSNGGAAGEPGVISIVFTANANTVGRIGTTNTGESISTATTTVFRGVVDQHGLAATEVPNTQNQFTHACTLQNLAVFCGSKGRSKADTVTLRKNVANGNLTVSITGSGLFEDLTHTDSIVANDKVDISLTTGSGAGIDNFSVWTVEQSTTDSTSEYVCANASSSSNTINAGTSVALPLAGIVNTASASNELQVQSYAQLAQTLQSLSVNVIANSSTSSMSITLRKNAANTIIAASITTGTTGFFSDPDAVSVAVGDLLNYTVTGGTSGTITIFSINIYGAPVAAVVMGFDEDGREVQSFPFMWSLGRLSMLAECEQFDWGWKPPMTKVTMEETQYDYPPMLQSFGLSRERRQMWDEREQFDWGFKPPMTKVTMEEVQYDYPPMLQSFGLSRERRQMWDEREQFDWGFDKSRYFSCRDEIYYEVIPSLMPNYLQVDGTSELEAITEDFVHEMVSVDLQYLFSPQLEMHYVEDDQFGFNTPVTTVQQAFDQDEGIVNQLLVFQGTSEDEAITEDFVHEMVSLDLQYTNPPWLNFMLEEEPFGFQTAVVIVTQPWDGEDNPADRAWSAKQDLDDLSFEPAICQNPLDESNYDYSVQSNTVWQTTDEDSAQSEFFVTDRVPEDYEQFVVGGQLALYWNDDDASQSTFFSREQYADIDEQFIITTQRLFHEEDFGQQVQFIVSDQTVDGYLAPRFITMEDDGFGMQAPFITSVPFDDGPDQLPLITFVHDDVETFGFNQPVVVVVNPFDQDELIPVARMGYAEDEAFGFEVEWAEAREQEFTVILVSAFLVDDGQPGITSGFSNTDTDQQPWQAGYANQDDEPFGLNPPFLTVNSEPWEQWGQLASPPYPTTYQVELDQHGQQAPFLTAQPFDETEQRGDTWWARDVDDNWAFNTPEVEGELLLEEELQISNRPYPLWQQMEDEQFGERAPFITAQPFDDTLDQIGQPWWAREQTEETQPGQNPPFLTAQPFDEDQFTRQGLVYEDEEVFSFNSALVQGQDEIPSSMDTLSLRQSDVEVGVTIEQDYSDTLGDYTQVLLRISEDEVFGFQTQQLVQQEPDDVPPAKTWLGIDEEVFGFQTSHVFLPWDAEYNPTGQQSYYFGSEDLEKYNWGWLLPMTKVAEDDSPYDSRVQMQSYLVPAMEDEQFSWGLDRSEFYGLGDEAPYFTPPQQRTQYVPELEDEQFSWGFRQAVFTAFDRDEVPVITLQRWGNDEDFGQQVQFIGLGQELEPIQNSYVTNGLDEDSTSAPVWGFDTVHLEGPNVKFVVLSDEDVLGFQTAVVTAISAFEQDELLGIEKRTYAEDETFGFEVGFTPTEDIVSGANGPSLSTSVTDDEKGLIIDISLSPDESGPTQGYQVQAEDEAFGLNVQFLMAWPGEEGQQPNLPQPVTHQKELEQFGQQAPFLETIGLSPEEQHLPWPPYPTTYQVELEQVGLNAPFIQAVSLDWDIEQGSKYWAPWAIDHNDYNVGQISIGFMVPKIWNFTVACTIVMAQWSVRAMQQVWQMEAEGTVAIQDCEVRAQIEVMDIQVIAQVQIQDFQVRA